MLMCMLHIVAVEDQLCQEIFKLQHYRQIGITTFKGMLVLRSNDVPSHISWRSPETVLYKSVLFQQLMPICSSQGAKLYEKLEVQRRQQASLQKDLMKKKCSNEVSSLHNLQCTLHI